MAIGHQLWILIFFLSKKDFNIDFYFNSADRHLKKFKDLLLNFNLHNTVKWPTKVTDGTSKTIDNIFTNFPDRSFSNIVIDNTFSDHRTILSEYNILKKYKIKNVLL